MTMRSMFLGFSVSSIALLNGCFQSTDDRNQPDSSPQIESRSPQDFAVPQTKPKDAASNVDLTNTTAITADGKTDWPQWRGPNGNSISSETGLIHEFPESGPKILWRKSLGTGFSGLTVAGGRLFTLFGENGREKIVCFNAETGDELWKVDSDADFAKGRSFGPRATPCVDGDRVYAVGASGMLFCLDVKTGKKIWSYNIYDKFDMQRFINEEGLAPSPLIDGKKLIVVAGSSVFALDKANGEVIWRAMEEKFNHSTPTFAKLDGRRQLVVLSGSNLAGLDPESGKELWRHEQRAVNCVTPVVGPNDQVFTGASYGFGCQLVKVTGGTAKQIYKNTALATHHATAVLYDGHLYGFHDRPGIFKCVEFATGKEKWVTRASGKGKLIIADGQIILISEAGQLLLAPVSTDGFEPTAKVRLLKGTCYTAPTLANGKLYVRSDKEMVCIDMKK